MNIPAGDNTGILRAMKAAQPGEILVVDGKGYTERAVAGDFVIGLAKYLGLQGIIIDGAVRDIKGIRDLDFPYFAKLQPYQPVQNRQKVNYKSLSCGGVSVNPGDLIVGDEDGVIVVPKEKEEQILKATLEKLKKDEQREQNYLGSREKALQYLNSLFA